MRDKNVRWDIHVKTPFHYFKTLSSNNIPFSSGIEYVCYLYRQELLVYSKLHVSEDVYPFISIHQI